MEQVGNGDINTGVDMAGSITNEIKDGGNSVGDDYTDIALMGDQSKITLWLFFRVIMCGNVPKRAAKITPLDKI